MRVARVIVLVLALAACKRQDPHPSPSGPVTPAAVAGDVPAGSLRSDTIELWMAVLFPETPGEADVAKLREAARVPGVEVDPAAPPAGRWVEVKPSIPRDAGFVPGDQGPTVRGLDESDLPKLDRVEAAIVLGAGGPAADVDAIHRDLYALAHAAALSGAGWILDEQTYVVYTAEAFAEGSMQKPRAVQYQIAIYVNDNADATTTLTTGGLSRFGLPELRARVDDAEDAKWTDALDDAAQLLIDHGGLDTAGVLQGTAIRWSASWATSDQEGGRLIELTPS